MSTIGERIAEIRKDKGLTQFQLAVAIGKDSMTVSRWERGVADVRTADLEKIAEALDAKPGDFFVGGNPVGGEAA